MHVSLWLRNPEHAQLVTSLAKMVGGTRVHDEKYKPWGVSHALTKSFLNSGNVLGRMLRSPGKQVASGLVTDDGGHRSGQLIIGELVQEVQWIGRGWCWIILGFLDE